MNEIFNFSDKKINYSLFGLLLGDGWIQNLRTKRKNKQLVIQHSMKQETYMNWLEEIFKNWNIYRYSHYNQSKIASFGELQYCTLCGDIPDLRHFLKFNRFYDDNFKKRISEYVLKRITPLGLLFWFLDDGCLSVSKRKSLSKEITEGYRMSRFATISTNSFSYNDHLTAQKIFKDRFNIDLKIHQGNKNGKTFYRLYFSAENFRKFYDIIRPYLSYIPKELYYKFDMKYSERLIKTKSDLRSSKDINFLNYNIPTCTISYKKDNDIVHSVENISKETV